MPACRSLTKLEVSAATGCFGVLGFELNVSELFLAVSGVAGFLMLSALFFNFGVDVLGVELYARRFELYVQVFDRMYVLICEINFGFSSCTL